MMIDNADISWLEWRNMVDACQDIPPFPPDESWYADSNVMLSGCDMYISNASKFDVQQARTAWAYIPSLVVCFHADDDADSIYAKSSQLRQMGLVNICVWTHVGDKIDVHLTEISEL
jgi:hypothetical protein